MPLTLTVDTMAWNRHVDSMASSVNGLVPVVKGNGYGFGRDWLAERASAIAPTLAVGTIYEVSSVPNCDVLVLTPSLHVPSNLSAQVILSVGSAAHIEAAAQSSSTSARRVLIKIRSSMNRYGAASAEISDLIALAKQRGLEVCGVSIHPPLAGPSTTHAQEIVTLLTEIDPTLAAWVSHIDIADFAILQNTYPERTWFLRLGTSLWHGDKNTVALTAEVIETIAVTAGTVAGYHGHAVDQDGTLIMIDAGSAHGIAPLADSRSPFHFDRQRLDLFEAPHMHTSMGFVPRGRTAPQVGDRVDVQRPLITTTVDVINWA